MYKIMSNRCTYPEIHYEGLEPTILVEENVIWDDQDNSNIEEQASITYANSANTTLTETGNESYVTAAGDNTTQYFSVLETSNETILNDISDVTINSSVIQGNDVEGTHLEENSSIDVNNGQVVLFKVDGSDELYGFQLIHDDEGNLQKYQFKVRQNIEGNLEAIPETLQILPVNSFENEEIIREETIERNTETFQDVEDEAPHRKANQVLVKEEHVTEDLSHELNEEEILEEQLDSKEGILGLVTPTATQKQELQEEVSNIESNEYDVDPHSKLGEDDQHQLEQEDEEEEEEIYYTHEDGVVDEGSFAYDDAVTEDPAATDETPTSEGHYEELFVKESHLMDDTNGETETNGIEQVEDLNESDNEEYEAVESVHVAEDPTENMYENADIRKSPSYQASNIALRKKIIKNVIRKVRIQKNDGKTNLYYLIKNPEKENMGRILTNSTKLNPNPRSILKCSIAATESQKYEDDEEKYDKRFAKSKEAQQARQFHNFIAQTKIIHAPVRQGRLPRKQQITPMKRTDEEIVVQEVVVSSNGFIETSEEGVLKERVQLKPTEYIQLTDSDEDFDPKSPHKKKRKGKKRKPMVEITISDTDDESSDESLQDLDEDSNEKEVASPVILKRPRGRPPKHQDKDEDKELVKRPRGRPPKYPKPQSEEPEEEIIVIKIDNKCPKCPKSFPSEGSLRSHMQYHNFCQTKSSDTKYMCEKCGDTFKNNFLLNRHINSHKTSNITCGNCKKVFNDQAQLAAHKKIHIKQQMFRNTTLLRDSPRSLRLSAKNKCKDCGKIFQNMSALSIHQKQHSKLFCQSCNKHFSSKFTLGNHLRLDCVKRMSRSPKKQLSANKNRQSAIPVPNKAEISQIVKPLIPTSSTVVTNIKCDSCSMTFATYTSLFKHKVLKHGLDSPGKSVVEGPTRKSVFKNKMPHSGVRPSLGLKNAFVGLQSKLEAYKNSQKKT
ncbi:zinc finger protein [Oryctes borbonicus]|uniref:Zinc finger protein n=1 Tax=Oryctes borbonicus TaxID=1629725 RepID=A0A0T6AZG4_9SCAR|nr:zinc finger protein [Oryctes borbonicus]